jgi:transcriptional regulator with XRE-family HTH domain
MGRRGKKVGKASRKARPSRGRRFSQRALAKRLQVSHTAIAKGVRSGRLTLPLEPEKSAREWAAGATKAPPPVATPEPAGGTLIHAQLQVAEARVDSIRILNAQRSGRLIDATVARREAFESARSIRDAVLAVPDRLSAELAAESDAGRVHSRLREELRAALEMVAEVLARGA